MEPVPTDDIAVRSVRVAVALVQRFHALIDGRVAGVDDLEMKIGEVGQLYPEIWSNLDAARAALAARGRDVAEYDALRSAEGVPNGVLDVDAHQGLNSYTKSASFNLGGAERAGDACRVLMRAMPEIDWAAIKRAEDASIAAAGSMWNRRWINLAKAIGAAAVLIGAAILIHRVATSPAATAPRTPPTATSEPARPPAPAKPDPVRDPAEARFARINALLASYRTSCDRTVLPELLQLLRDAGEPNTAATLEHEACALPHPSCDDARRAIEARLAVKLEHCEGIVLGAPGATEPGLLVTAADGARSLRGVVSPDGARDLIALAPAPVPTWVGVADLDANLTDELVAVGAGRIVITRITHAGFVDVDGPALPAGCQASANVERDFRAGRTGERKLLVITVDDPKPAKRCPPTGRWYYGLAGDAVAAID